MFTSAAFQKPSGPLLGIARPRGQPRKEFVSTNLISSGTTAREKVNLRTPDVMAAVQEQVESHYRSDVVEEVRRNGGIISVGDVTVRLGEAIWILLRRRARHRSGLCRAQSF